MGFFMNLALNKECFDYDLLFKWFRVGFRRGAWVKLSSLEKGLFKCCLALAKVKGRISNLKLMVILAKIALKLLKPNKAFIIQAGLVKAQALKKLYAFKGVFNWCPNLKEWFKDSNYIFWLGLNELYK